MVKKLTKEQVLFQFKQIHGSFFDYSNVNYKRNDIEVEIICPIHGSFWQTPTKHKIYKISCPDCAEKSRSDKRSFSQDKIIEEFKKVHGNRYNYKKVKYIKQIEDVIITCPIHGDFPQKPVHHLQGKGCKKCGRIKVGFSNRKCSKKFFNACAELHNNKYDYSKSVYNTSKDKIIITCPIHGDFKKYPSEHLRRIGCQKCSMVELSKQCSMSFEEFIKRSREVHGDKYTYYEDKWERASVKTIINCPEHGEFPMKGTLHVHGQECPDCQDKGLHSQMEKEWLDSLNIDNLERQYRIDVPDYISRLYSYYIVDGYDPNTNTVYEFLGDYWHSNIASSKIFPDEIHPNIGITHAQNYLKTIERLQNLENMNYNIIYIWEKDWLR